MDTPLQTITNSHSSNHTRVTQLMEEYKNSIFISELPVWAEKAKVFNADRKNDSPLTTLLLDHKIHIPSDSSYHRVVHRLETPQAVQHMSKVQLDFDPYNEEMHLHSVTIFRKGELIQHAKWENIEVLRREENLNRHILSGTLSVLLMLKDVRTGDIIDVEHSIKSKSGLFSHKRCLVQYSQSTNPVRKSIATWIDKQEAKFSIQGDVKDFTYREAVRDGELSREWIVENTLEREDENDIPEDELIQNFFQCSNYASWSEISNELHVRWLKQPSLRASLNDLLEMIRSSCETKDDIVKCVISEVINHVRYQAVHSGLLAMIPEDIGVVWDRKYGDCKEKTFLLVWILCELGFDAQPVLVHTNLKGAVTKLLPYAGAFNHVVAKVSYEGKTLWIDATDIYRGGDPIQWSHLNFKIGLPIQEGETNLTTIPFKDDAISKCTISEKISFNSKHIDGELAATITLTETNAEWMRAKIDFEGNVGLVNYINAIINNSRKGFELSEDPKWQDDKLQNVVKISFMGILRDPFTNDEKNHREIIGLFPFGFQQALSIGKKSQRKYPLAIRFPERIEHTLVLVHPRLLRVENERQYIHDPHVYLNYGSKMEGKLPAFYYFYQSSKDRVNPKEYANYYSNIKKINEALSLALQFPKKGMRKYSDSDY